MLIIMQTLCVNHGKANDITFISDILNGDNYPINVGVTYAMCDLVSPKLL